MSDGEAEFRDLLRRHRLAANLTQPRWLIDQEDREGAQRLAAAMTLFCFMRGHRTEGRGWLAQIWALDGLPGARLLFGTGLIALHQGDQVAAQRPLEEAQCDGGRPGARAVREVCGSRSRLDGAHGART